MFREPSLSTPNESKSIAKMEIDYQYGKPIDPPSDEKQKSGDRSFTQKDILLILDRYLFLVNQEMTQQKVTELHVILSTYLSSQDRHSLLQHPDIVNFFTLLPEKFTRLKFQIATHLTHIIYYLEKYIPTPSERNALFLYLKKYFLDTFINQMMNVTHNLSQDNKVLMTTIEKTIPDKKHCHSFMSEFNHEFEHHLKPLVSEFQTAALATSKQLVTLAVTFPSFSDTHTTLQTDINHFFNQIPILLKNMRDPITHDYCHGFALSWIAHGDMINEKAKKIMTLSDDTLLAAESRVELDAFFLILDKAQRPHHYYSSEEKEKPCPILQRDTDKILAIPRLYSENSFFNRQQLTTLLHFFMLNATKMNIRSVTPRTPHSIMLEVIPGKIRVFDANYEKLLPKEFIPSQFDRVFDELINCFYTVFGLTPPAFFIPLEVDLFNPRCSASTSSHRLFDDSSSSPKPLSTPTPTSPPLSESKAPISLSSTI